METRCWFLTWESEKGNRSQKRSLTALAFFSALYVLVSLTVLQPVFAAGFETEIGKIADRMGKGETVAVAAIYRPRYIKNPRYPKCLGNTVGSNKKTYSQITIGHS